jgi:hypothetical protein
VKSRVWSLLGLTLALSLLSTLLFLSGTANAAPEVAALGADPSLARWAFLAAAAATAQPRMPWREWGALLSVP